MRASTPAHVLVVGTTAPSHLTPALAVVAELVRRGHRVTHTVGAPLADLVAPTGARVVPCTTVLPVGGDGGEWPGDPVGGLALFVDEAAHVLPQIRAALDDDPPDIVLYDVASPAGPVAAHAWGTPAVCLSPAMVAWPGFEDDLPDHADLMRRSPAGRALHARFAAWLGAHGVDRDPYDLLGYPSRTIALIPRVMQPNADRLGATVRFVGPCLDPARLDAAWAPPEGAAPVVCVSLGTAYTDRPDLFRRCIEALAGDHHLVLAIGDRFDRAELGRLPSGVEVHRWIPQLAVLRRTAAFVTHAGMGSVQEALWAGVPMACAPQAVDQFGNAAAVEALGVGVRLPQDVTADAVRAAVTRLTTDPAVAAGVAGVRDAVRREAGPDRAADAVEEVLTGRW